MPASVMPAGTATTQPMPMPRTSTSGLKPSRPGVGQSTRSTQRIVLPTPPGAKPNSTKALSMGMASGRINLPIGMILRCLPPEVLAEELSKFEANGTAATEIGLPMNMILSQLPSGKVEMALQDLIPHFPAGYLQPTESIASYLPTMVNLPLMDVVMRIPPDLLALRPDQKDVDAAVINMADPFTEEILREQAEAAHQQSQTKIIDESQAPQEEFVPRDQAGMIKPSVPPRRPPVEPVIPARTPTAAKLPPPPSISSPAAMPPPVSTPVSRIASTSGQIPVPTRSAATIPIRPQDADTVPLDTPPPAPSTAPVPPVPRHTGPIPAPPPPRHTTSLPVPSRTGAIPGVAQPTAAPTATTPAPAEKPAPAARPPDANADDLKRLAALAMAELGEGTESATEAPSQPPPRVEVPAPAVASAPAPVSRPAPAPVAASAPAPASQPAPTPVFRPPTRVVPDSISKPKPATAPVPPVQQASTEPESQAAVAFNLNTCTAEDLVRNIPGCFPELAESIINYRAKIGSFNRLEELLDVPGITKAAYTNLTGEAPPDNRIALSLNELLGFPVGQHISLKDVTERIACWPDVTGCVLSQSTGLSLVGTVAEGVNKEAIVAFAPRMFESINKSFSEVSGQETDALVIPTTGTSFHLFRNRNLYLIIMSRLPQMPERHVKVARFVLAALSIRKD
ncbi:MAG: helix-hairpin-helix domain-containing protein [Methylacidiphilales bacterium]|nr:helix-hairpin-helix domain-containing protein [Candidatus Methylacidiphilales bacterium]